MHLLENTLVSIAHEHLRVKHLCGNISSALGGWNDVVVVYLPIHSNPAPSPDVCKAYRNQTASGLFAPAHQQRIKGSVENLRHAKADSSAMLLIETSDLAR
jgi:hypothetical protein